MREAPRTPVQFLHSISYCTTTPNENAALGVHETASHTHMMPRACPGCYLHGGWVAFPSPRNKTTHTHKITTQGTPDPGILKDRGWRGIAHPPRSHVMSAMTMSRRWFCCHRGWGPHTGSTLYIPPQKKQLNTQTCISSKKNVFYKIQPKNCYGKHFSPPTSVKKVWPLGFWTREYEKSIYLATFM